jgi:23S rRNA (adenine2503-C2)-methyltransferase
MIQDYGNTACLSTQVGCAYGCFMCATGKNGLKRNLTPAEIVSQFISLIKLEDIKIQNIVFMGMGEPLANYDNFKKSIDILTDNDGLAIGFRRITVSTCGVVTGIKRLIRDNLRINLSVSLHSTFNPKRDQLVPANKKHNIHELFTVCKEFSVHFKVPVTFEYVLINGVNDGLEECDNLIALIKEYKLEAKINLIPVNDVKAKKLKPSAENIINLWQKKLENAKIINTSRHERGADIAAACGQLAGE